MQGQCEVCNRYGQIHHHHWKTRGAHGKAAMVPENVIILCPPCHSLCHQIGVHTFAARYGLEERFEKAREAVQGKMNERYSRAYLISTR
jgi:5-methylcytosine-specific restriction endonuclease McrA